MPAAAAGKEAAVVAYAANVAKLALFSTAGGATAGTEVTGGSPAYVRVTPAVTGTGATRALAGTFNVPSGATVAGWGAYDAAGGYGVGGARASQGTYALTVTATGA
jgi:hypothetical protein